MKETKLIVLSENENTRNQSADGKILSKIFGVSSANVPLLKGIDLTAIFDKLEGRRIRLNRYPPSGLDEAKKPRYKVLFE